MVNTPGVGDHAAPEPFPTDGTYTDPTTSVRPSPLIEAANKARNVYASLSGVVNLAVLGGLVTANQVGALDLTVTIILGAVPVLVGVGTQLLAAAKTIRDAWAKVTPVNSPTTVIDGMPVRLVPATDVAPPGAPLPPAGL